MPASITSRTVLLVDDDENTRDIYVTTLRHAGYPVVAASDGMEALLFARQHVPALVVLDLKMPEMDGWTAMELMRAEPALADTVIVTLTVMAPGEDRRDPIRRGFDGHYVKPLSPPGLLAIVQEWIGPPPPAAKSAMLTAEPTAGSGELPTVTAEPQPGSGDLPAVTAEPTSGSEEPPSAAANSPEAPPEPPARAGE